jgi:hypothetical protein
MVISIAAELYELHLVNVQTQFPSTFGLYLEFRTILFEASLQHGEIGKIGNDALPIQMPACRVDLHFVRLMKGHAL